MKFLKIWIIVFSVSVIVNIIYRYRKDSPCSCLVTTDMGEKIRAKRLNWYNSGFVDIKKCDGSNITLRNNSVLKVEALKDIKR
jgi:hypothetical protein